MLKCSCMFISVVAGPRPKPSSPVKSITPKDTEIYINLAFLSSQQKKKQNLKIYRKINEWESTHYVILSRTALARICMQMPFSLLLCTIHNWTRYNLLEKNLMHTVSVYFFFLQSLVVFFRTWIEWFRFSFVIKSIIEYLEVCQMC